jgi:alkaline phosphatase D
MKRRDFLRSSGWFVVGAALVGVPACGDNFPPDETVELAPMGTFGFPQGVASGDPRAASVVLWTRVVLSTATTGTFGAVPLRVQVSADASFSTLVVDEALTATQANDHTVRVLVTGLASATDYYYRFVAGQDVTTGRTRTAPDAAADVQVNLAWVSCQDYNAGHYGAYRQLIIDDDARPAADKIHAVVHLGDMIYETRADAFQSAIDDDFKPIKLTNRDGKTRALAAFPSGGGTRVNGTQSVNFASTVDDYRHLYRTFLADPDLQAARARWPFVTIWDDHEFTDDCWQSQANYTGGTTVDEADQARRVAASQAWFEYIPVQLTGAEGVKGVANQARDFVSAQVSNAAFTAPNDDNFVAEPNNAAAIGAITIYRSLRFGKHVELVMTDERSYRSDHAIPEDLTVGPLAALFFAPRNALPLPLVNTFDQGKTANNNNPADTVILVPGVIEVPNVRKGSPAGTMLGKQQKAWWKATMKGSDATWKLWGNEVSLMRMKIQKLGAADASDRLLSGDAWDGYPTERNELMTYLRDEAIKNVVVLSGDIHASFAGTVMHDFDTGVAFQVPVATELVAPGISSNSLFSFFEAASRAGDPALRGLITVDASAGGGAKFTENFNLLLLHGTTSAGTFAGAIAAGAPPAAALQAALGAADATVNPHLKYVDTNTQGYGYVKVTGAAVDATIVTINRPVAAPVAAGPGIKRTASFTIPKDDPAGMVGPTFTGTKPFPVT